MRIGLAIRRRRLSLGLTQRMVGAAVDCSQPYLSQVERGRRPISEKIARRLEQVLEAPGLFTWAPFLRGRPPLIPQSRQVSRSLRLGARPSEPTPELGRCPRFKQVHQRWGIEDRLAFLGPVTQRLEERRGMDERYWRSVNTLRYDSGTEVRLIGALSGLEGQWTGVKLKKLGCSLTLVNGKTGGPFKGHHRCFLFKYKHASLAWAPQIPVRTRLKYRTPDNVLLIRAGGTTVTAVVEVAGSQYHTPDELRARQMELGVPLLVIDPSRIHEPDLMETILQWALELAEPVRDLEVDRKGLTFAVDYRNSVVGSGTLMDEALSLHSPARQPTDRVFLAHVQGGPGLLRAGPVVTSPDRLRESA
ncbi:helix-turn-helix transcriptional regulator [bacterium]|nr:helix-turn-helix transcriptional regulator [bacterium]